MAGGVVEISSVVSGNRVGRRGEVSVDPGDLTAGKIWHPSCSCLNDQTCEHGQSHHHSRYEHIFKDRSLMLVDLFNATRSDLNFEAEQLTKVSNSRRQRQPKGCNLPDSHIAESRQVTTKQFTSNNCVMPINAIWPPGLEVIAKFYQPPNRTSAGLQRIVSCRSVTVISEPYTYACTHTRIDWLAVQL